MYPVALYGSLPEIAYLVPRGGFRVHGAVEEEPTPRCDQPRRPAPIGDERRTALSRRTSEE
jgi:hypothetical protein